MAATGAKPKATDFTGREREKLQKEHAEELALRAQEMSMASVAAAEAAANTVTDLTQSAPVVIDSVEEVEINLSSATVVIRVNEDIEDMTFGVGNNYSFKAGQKYKVPKNVADHLEEKGYVWH
jgi:hypothetical protein